LVDLGKVVEQGGSTYPAHSQSQIHSLLRRQAFSREQVEDAMNAFELSNVAREIYEYLRLHPGAKDSAEGIARWWVEADVPQVRDALEELAEKKLIGKSEGPRRVLYYAIDQGDDEPLIVTMESTEEQNSEPVSHVIRPVKSLLDLTEEFATLNNAKILFGGQLASQSETRWEELKGFYDALMGHTALNEPSLRHFPVEEIKNKIQSRTRLRVQTELGITIKHDSRYHSAQAMNVSCGGLLVATQKAIEVGSPLTLCLSSIGNGLVVDGQVIWSSERRTPESSFQDKMGVKFSRLQQADRDKLDAFVIDVLGKHLVAFDPTSLGPDFVHREHLVLSPTERERR
jgi:Tfp pilus assembly protein PilZ